MHHEVSDLITLRNEQCVFPFSQIPVCIASRLCVLAYFGPNFTENTLIVADITNFTYYCFYGRDLIYFIL